MGDESAKYASQLLLALEDPQNMVGADGRLDVSFLHQSFCMAGLPVRSPADPRYFVRRDDRFSLMINSEFVGLPGSDQTFHVGVPWGAKARLLTIWMATQAKDPSRSSGDRFLEIGAVKPWLASIGITPNGDGIARAKEQLIKLAFASFTMMFKESGVHMFKSDRLVDRAAFGDGDLLHFSQGSMEKVRWPLGIELTEKALIRFREYGVPIPTSRLTAIANNATAIDLFVFLCYRLPQLSPAESELVSWNALAGQFGKVGGAREPPSRFRDTFEGSIAAALRAYPEANVELTNEGLVLRYSDPAVLRRAFIAASPEPATARRRKRRNRTEEEPAMSQ
jgi:hypothetical protein